MDTKQGKKSGSILMTEGVIWKQLVLFSVPLLIGNLFQQLYNTVDSIVVGQFIGREALAAVGSSTPIITLIIGMFMGIAVGAGVIISQYYGARSEEKMGWAVHTSIALSIIGGLLLSVAGIACSPLILGWMRTPEEVFGPSVLYFRIYFLGSLFNLLYNMGAGILQAVGDSRRPLYYLCISSVVNIVLDILFVAGFHMGVDGVAWATIISQLVSAILVMSALMRTKDIYRLEIKKIRIDKRMMKRILKIGIPSGIQQSIISLSNVVVQANVNVFGAAVMAGFGAYNKVDGFVVLPMQSFCMAATTFTGQNIGARKPERIREGIKQGIIICAAVSALLSVLLFFESERILSIFSSDPSVIQYGMVTMRILVGFYVVLAVHQILMGVMRGAGKSMETMLISVGNMCVLRMIYIKLVIPILPSYEAVLWCYPLTWLTTILMDIMYMKWGKWMLPGENKGEVS